MDMMAIMTFPESAMIKFEPCINSMISINTVFPRSLDHLPLHFDAMVFH